MFHVGRLASIAPENFTNDHTKKSHIMAPGRGLGVGVGDKCRDAGKCITVKRVP